MEKKSDGLMSRNAIGRELGISTERVRIIEMNALAKLRAHEPLFREYLETLEAEHKLDGRIYIGWKGEVTCRRKKKPASKKETT